MRLVLTALGLLLLLQPGITPAQQPASTEAAVTQLVALASGWTSRFENGLSGMLFRERFLQRTMVSHTERQSDSASELVKVPENTTRLVPREVLLEASVFMLKPPSSRDFVLYRDVYRVGTEDVSPDAERLRKLFAAGTADSLRQARAITDGSARFTLVGIPRRIDAPTMAFAYLAGGMLPGLRVRATERDRINGLDVIVVEFQEAARPTVVRGPANEDVPASGRFWIHPESGAVVRAQVVLNAGATKGRVDVTLELNQALGAWVPKEMREVWETGAASVTVLAQYDRFERLTLPAGDIIR